MKKLLLFLGVLICFFSVLFFPASSFAATLFSSGFEDGNLSSWSSSGGGATATISAENVRSGNNAIKIQNDKTGSYGFQQVIPNIEGGMFYEARGYGKAYDSSTASFFIRVAWYSSSDGSGSQLSSPSDSNVVDNVSNDWTLLTTNAIQAPSTANSAKIRLVLNSKTSGQLALAYFDDILFQESIAPTATPTLTPTPSPSPTPLKSSPTVRVSSTTYPTSRIKPTEKIVATESEEVLGGSTEDGELKIASDSPTPAEKVEVLDSTQPNISGIFMG